MEQLYAASPHGVVSIKHEEMAGKITKFPAFLHKSESIIVQFLKQRREREVEKNYTLTTVSG